MRDEDEIIDSRTMLELVKADRMSVKELREKFVDDFLSSEYVIFYTTSAAVTSAYWVVLHPQWPILVGMSVVLTASEDPVTATPQNFPSVLWKCFNWRYCTLITLDPVDFMTQVADFLRQRYSERGQSWLHKVDYGNDTDNSAFQYRFWLQACYDDDSLNYTLDAIGLYNKYKSLFSRDMNESRTRHNSVAIGNGAWSEDMWPQLQGFNTQYIDNIGVFVPTGFTINAKLTDLIRKAGIEHGYSEDRMAMLCILEKSSRENTLQDYSTSQNIEPFTRIPYVGSVISMITGWWETSNKTVQRQFWPILAAFGRNSSIQTISARDLMYVHAWYYKSIQTQAKGPTIQWEEARVVFPQLARKLVDMGYVSEIQTADWLTFKYSKATDPSYAQPVNPNYEAGGGGERF